MIVLRVISRVQTIEGTAIEQPGYDLAILAYGNSQESRERPTGTTRVKNRRLFWFGPISGCTGV